MSAVEAIHGLACPNCGGRVNIPEGQIVVACPYCELRSLVRGERGLLRSQVPRRIDRAQAEEALKKFLSGSRAIAGDAARAARLSEAFLAYLPFWVSRARALGWAFGQEKVGSGDKARYEAREVKIAEEMSWNGAACDVGEFGVESLPLSGQPFEPFDAEALHAQGMVFEPIGSQSEAQAASRQDFFERVRRMARLDRVSQVFTRLVRQRMGLVYYPLWVARYLYRGRVFQVVVDGYSGQVLYGKAPGSTLYRAVVLVGGMALGAFLAIDVSALAFSLGAEVNGDGGEALFAAGIGLLAAGFGLMAAAYRKFRYGEQVEYRLPREKARRFQRLREAGIFRAREVG